MLLGNDPPLIHWQCAKQKACKCRRRSEGGGGGELGAGMERGPQDPRYVPTNMAALALISFQSERKKLTLFMV